MTQEVSRNNTTVMNSSISTSLDQIKTQKNKSRNSISDSTSENVNQQHEIKTYHRKYKTTTVSILFDPFSVTYNGGYTNTPRLYEQLSDRQPVSTSCNIQQLNNELVKLSTTLEKSKKPISIDDAIRLKTKIDEIQKLHDKVSNENISENEIKEIINKHHITIDDKIEKDGISQKEAVKLILSKLLEDSKEIQNKAARLYGDISKDITVYTGRNSINSDNNVKSNLGKHWEKGKDHHFALIDGVRSSIHIDVDGKFTADHVEIEGKDYGVMFEIVNNSLNRYVIHNNKKVQLVSIGNQYCGYFPGKGQCSLKPKSYAFDLPGITDEEKKQIIDVTKYPEENDWNSPKPPQLNVQIIKNEDNGKTYYECNNAITEVRLMSTERTGPDLAVFFLLSENGKPGELRGVRVSKEKGERYRVILGKGFFEIEKIVNKERGCEVWKVVKFSNDISSDQTKRLENTTFTPVYVPINSGQKSPENSISTEMNVSVINNGYLSTNDLEIGSNSDSDSAKTKCGLNDCEEYNSSQMELNNNNSKNSDVEIASEYESDEENNDTNNNYLERNNLNVEVESIISDETVKVVSEKKDENNNSETSYEEDPTNSNSLSRNLESVHERNAFDDNDDDNDNDNDNDSDDGVIEEILTKRSDNDGRKNSVRNSNGIDHVNELLRHPEFRPLNLLVQESRIELNGSELALRLDGDPDDDGKIVVRDARTLRDVRSIALKRIDGNIQDTEKEQIEFALDVLINFAFSDEEDIRQWIAQQIPTLFASNPEYVSEACWQALGVWDPVIGKIGQEKQDSYSHLSSLHSSNLSTLDEYPELPPEPWEPSWQLAFAASIHSEKLSKMLGSKHLEQEGDTTDRVEHINNIVDTNLRINTILSKSSMTSGDLDLLMPVRDDREISFGGGVLANVPLNKNPDLNRSIEENKAKIYTIVGNLSTETATLIRIGGEINEECNYKAVILSNRVKNSVLEELKENILLSSLQENVEVVEAKAEISVRNDLAGLYVVEKAREKGLGALQLFANFETLLGEFGQLKDDELQKFAREQRRRLFDKQVQRKLLKGR